VIFQFDSDYSVCQRVSQFELNNVDASYDLIIIQVE